jgi:hypothetical protein
MFPFYIGIYQPSLSIHLCHPKAPPLHFLSMFLALCDIFPKLLFKFFVFLKENDIVKVNSVYLTGMFSWKIWNVANMRKGINNL